MKALKLLIISVFVLFLLLTTIAALLPSEVRISRAVNIYRPLTEIYPYVATIKNWESWNLYVKQLEGKQWIENGVNGRTLKIVINHKQRKAVLTKWTQADGKTFNAGLNLIENGSVTTVQWYFDFYFRWYPWEKFSSIVYDAQVGPPMQESLQNLKDLVEQVH